uniref:RING-type domain-containing protein n=1 Tax=Mesocestoides corti TaxID=53468 RepID=A0A5K3F613_MESCO
MGDGDVGTYSKFEPSKSPNSGVDESRRESDATRSHRRSYSRSHSRSSSPSYGRSRSRSTESYHERRHRRQRRRLKSRSGSRSVSTSDSRSSSCSSSRSSFSRSRSHTRSRSTSLNGSSRRHDKDPRDRSKRHRWENNVWIVGEKPKDLTFHICDICDKPIIVYGRLKPCNHVFCFTCASTLPGTCHRVTLGT